MHILPYQSVCMGRHKKYYKNHLTKKKILQRHWIILSILYCKDYHFQILKQYYSVNESSKNTIYKNIYNPLLVMKNGHKIVNERQTIMWKHKNESPFLEADHVIMHIIINML